MLIKALVSGFEPDSLAIVAQELRAKFEQCLSGHLVGDQWNVFEFEVLVRGGRSVQKRSHSSGNVHRGKRRMKQQITTVFQIAEIDSQGAAIGNSCTARFTSCSLIGEPHRTSASQSNRAIHFVDALKFNVSK